MSTQPPSSSTAPAAAPAAASDPSLVRLAEEIHRLACRLTAQEWRFDELAAAIGSLEARHDQTQAAVDEVRTAVEPSRLAALGGLSPEEIARRGDYLAVVNRVRRTVRERLPKEARVLVIGRGDEDLVQLSGRRAAHFPQDAAGDFAGEYPGTGGEAVDQLRDLVGQGWDHLVIPSTSFWWLDSYPEFRIHLLREWHAVHRDENCLIFVHDPGRPGPWQRLDEVVSRIRTEEARLPAILDWDTGCDVAELYPACAVFPPLDRGLDRLPYIERSIDVVAVPWDKPERVVEARRIATAAIVRIAPPGVRDVGFFVAVEQLEENAGGARAHPGARLGLVVPNRQT
jgi:hypothetical protein